MTIVITATAGAADACTPQRESNGGIMVLKRINIRFEQDNKLGDIEVIVRADGQDDQVSELIRSLKKRGQQKLMVLDRDNCQSVIEENDIVLVSADGKVVRIVATNGVYSAKQSLQSVEQLLGRSFLRVSRFEIVNLKKVKKYDFTIVGTLRIEFENGMETWASRRYIPQIRKRLSGEEGYLC